MTFSFSMRIWCSNHRYMQYWLSSDPILIINPSYDVHHLHESRSDGMDHQWFQNTILIDIIRMTFLNTIWYYIYDYHLSPWCNLWCGNMATLIRQKEPDFLSDKCYLTGIKLLLNISLSVLLIYINLLTWYLMSIP